MQTVSDNVSLAAMWQRTEAIDRRVCAAIAGGMRPCFLPLQDIAIVASILLGETWREAVESLIRIQVQSAPSREEHIGRLLLAFRSYCQGIEARSTPAAFRERTDSCRRITESVARRMSALLGGEFIAFESSNPFAPIRARRASSLAAIPFAVGIAEIDRTPHDARTIEPGEHRAHC